MTNFKAERDSYDHHVRRFAWFEYNRDYAPVLSANLMASLCRQKDPQQSTRVQAEAKTYLVGETSATNLLPAPLAESLRQTRHNVSSRIFFRLLPRAVVAREFKGGDNALRGIVWNPAQVIDDRSAAPDFAGKVVPIGSDFEENGDYHDTAFGPVAGSYLLANSVNMVLAGNIPRENICLDILAMCCIGFLFCFLYACFRPVIVNCTIFAVSFLAPFIISVVFNRYGLVVDVWIPLLGIGIYNTIIDLICDKNIIGKLKIWKSSLLLPRSRAKPPAFKG